MKAVLYSCAFVPSEWIAAHGWNGLLARFVEFTFKSFWGVFGWMGVFLDNRIYLALAPRDLRKGFDGLSAEVSHVLRRDPFSEHLFVFRSKRGDRLKALW